MLIILPQLWIFFVKISGNASRAVTNIQNLGNNIVFLPTTSPCFPIVRDAQFRMQGQIREINAFVTRKSRITWQTMPIQSTSIQRFFLNIQNTVYVRLLVFRPNQLWSLKFIFFKSWPVSTANSTSIEILLRIRIRSFKRKSSLLFLPWKRLAKEPLALSNGVSPSLLASDTMAPWAIRSSATCW